MNQNSTVDNDLQKAIDDITNNTNTDPVFSDPVAAPSSVPEGDTGELDEPVGPFPDPAAEMLAHAAEPVVAPQYDPNALPELDVTMPEPIAPTAPMAPVEPVVSITPEPTPLAPETQPVIETRTTINSTFTPSTLNMHQVKEAALRDLVPLLDNLNMSPTQKFNIYRNVFEELRDYTVLERVYRAASEIPNDTERAEALLYLIESIDKM